LCGGTSKLQKLRRVELMLDVESEGTPR
jgi:hypothetical protein